MKLIVGLGNPGEKYAGNRHNIGFMSVDEMARGYSFTPWKRRFQGLAAEGQIGVQKCILLKPGTFMNESGRSVGEAMRFYKLSAGDVIAVHDELDLKPGAVRVKTGGGNAGHNGLKSISAHIGNDYTRVRLGIGHPGDKALVSNYVLHDFSKADAQWLGPLLEGVAKGMARLAEGGEAAFLSEAARGRPASAAAKVDGTTPPTVPMKTAPPANDAASAVPSRPIEAMPVVKVSVFAARGGGSGGTASTARVMSEPEKGRPSFDRTAIIMAQPAPATLPVEVATPVAAPEAPAIHTKTAAQEAKVFAPASTAAVQQRGGFLGWWFRKRIRGGAGI